MVGFFELQSPRDMLEKARREHARLSTNLDIDNVFNFFVTINHIGDYAKKSGLATTVIADFYAADNDISDARDICNKAKHMTLTPGRFDPATKVVDSHVGVGRVGEMMLGAEITWFLVTNTGQVDVMALASKVLRKWEVFLTTNGF